MAEIAHSRVLSDEDYTALRDSLRTSRFPEDARVYQWFEGDIVYEIFDDGEHDPVLVSSLIYPAAPRVEYRFPPGEDRVYDDLLHEILQLSAGGGSTGKGYRGGCQYRPQDESPGCPSSAHDLVPRRLRIVILVAIGALFVLAQFWPDLRAALARLADLLPH